MKIVIATKGRADEQRTLKEIYKSFRKDEIDLVVEPQEIEKYRKYEKIAGVVDLGANDRGIVFVRNWITKNYDGVVFILDDDLIDFRMRTKKNEKGYWKMKKTNATEIRNMFLRIEKFILSNKNYAQATISYCKSNWLYDKNEKEITRVWAFKANNNDILKREGIVIGEKAGTFEDYDQTLKILAKGYKNISFYNWGFNCVPMGTNAGGLQEQRKLIIRESVEYMKKYWGIEIVKEFWSKQHDLPEIKVKWKKAFNIKKI